MNPFARVRSLATAHVAAARAATPGTRFTTRFEERSHIPRLHPRRLLRLLLGVGLFTFGMANIFIPGPGGSVFILGSALVLSGELHSFARLLDWGEVRFQCPIMFVLRRPIIATTTITIMVFATVTFVGSRVL
jgi:hypothetical protein